MVSVWRVSAEKVQTEVARWCFEVGDDNSPGCHFHVQVKASEEGHLFPPSLSVPRLPGMLVTPIDAADFLLGELFQEEWTRHLAKETDNLRRWSRCQRRRLSNVLGWQREEVSRSSGAAWMALKRAKPARDRLLQ
jgi:hypothetical protein